MQIPIPPQALASLIGPGDPQAFKFVGADLAAWVKEYARLQPDGSILDVGCGVGRIAIQLMPYLNARGSYDGFDLMRNCVDWCDQNLTPIAPNFRFQHADLHSPMYNAGGKERSETFRFPYPDRSFDVVVLFSVFSHMLPAAVEHYVQEIRRVLKPGGRVLTTFYLLDDYVRQLMREGRSRNQFTDVEPGVYAVTDLADPEAAVAYETRWAQDVWGRNGFGLRGTYPGRWSGRLNSYSGQDMILAVRE